MTPEVEKKLLEYLGVLENTIKEGKDFTIQQAPEVAKEIVSYGFASNLICSVCLIFAIFGSAIFAVKLAKWAVKEIKDPFPAFLIIAVWLFLVMFILPFTFTQINQTAKAYFAPKLYVIDYLRSEVKR